MPTACITFKAFSGILLSLAAVLSSGFTAKDSLTSEVRTYDRSLSPELFSPGAVTVRGRIVSSDTAKQIPSVIMLTGDDVFTGDALNFSIDVDEQGNFSSTFTIPYSVEMYCEPDLGHLFLVPGDTLTFTADCVTRKVDVSGPAHAVFHRQRYDERKNSLFSDLPWGAWAAVKFDSAGRADYLKDVVNRLDKYASQLPERDSVTDSPMALARMLAETMVLEDGLTRLSELRMHHNNRKYYFRHDSVTGLTHQMTDSTWRPIDFSPVYELFSRYPGLFWENPALMLTSSAAEMYVNRLQYNEFLPLLRAGLPEAEQSSSTEIADALARVPDVYTPVLEQISAKYGVSPASTVAQACALRYYKQAVEGKDNEYVDRLYMSVMQAMRTTLAAQRLTELRNCRQAELGDSVPAEMPELLAMLLQTYEGKAVVLDFWAEWCGPCRYSLSSMRPVIDRWKDDDRVAFVLVTDDDNPEKSLGWLRENKIGGSHVVIPKSQWFSLMAELKFSAIPCTFAIPRSRKLSSTTLKPYNIHFVDDKLIEEIIAQ